VSFGTITTLNIEGGSARVLSVRGRKVERWGTAPLPSESVRDALIIDPAGVGTVINNLFKSAKVPKSTVLVSVTGFRSVFRIITLPKLNATLIKEAIQWAARREMHMAVEELYLSWQAVSSDETEQRIFLLGTPRSLIDSVYQSLRAAGIKPRTVDLKPLALSRIVNRAEAIIIDLETESMSIIILSNGIPEVMHTIIVKPEESLLEDRVQKLTEDFSRTVSFYNQAHNEHPLDSTTPVFLTGEIASNPDVVALFQKSLGYPITPQEVVFRYSGDLPVYQYAVNIGLALRKLAPRKGHKGTFGQLPSININVLPMKYRR